MTTCVLDALAGLFWAKPEQTSTRMQGTRDWNRMIVPLDVIEASLGWSRIYLRCVFGVVNGGGIPGASPRAVTRSISTCKGVNFANGTMERSGKYFMIS